jgi:hypothetical protein
LFDAAKPQADGERPIQVTQARPRRVAAMPRGPLFLFQFLPVQKLPVGCQCRVTESAFA